MGCLFSVSSSVPSEQNYFIYGLSFLSWTVTGCCLSSLPKRPIPPIFLSFSVFFLSLHPQLDGGRAQSLKLSLGLFPPTLPPGRSWAHASVGGPSHPYRCPQSHTHYDCGGCSAPSCLDTHHAPHPTVLHPGFPAVLRVPEFQGV